MHFVKVFEEFLVGFAQKVSPEIFVVVGGLLEEIIAPIPSPLVGVTAGSIALAQHKGVPYLFFIGLIAALAKTFGCWVFYFIADKAEDVITKRFGRFLGFSHKEIESIGKLFNGTFRDEIILATIRAIPIMPTTPVSVACGFIKMRLRSYLGATFVGNYIRGMMFIFVGYSGLSVFNSVISGVNDAESIMNVVIVLALAGFLGFVYYNRKKGGFRKLLQQREEKEK